MKVTVTEQLGIQLEEVFSGVTLKTDSGEIMSICMRDTGFEFSYQGQWYFAKEGYLEPFHVSPRGNYLVSELQRHENDIPVCNPS